MHRRKGTVSAAVAAAVLLCSLAGAVPANQPQHAEPPQAVCILRKQRGSCTNFTLLWHFDADEGDCVTFWYGGCDGNGNRFATTEACRALCVDPAGAASCLQPAAVSGPCTDSAVRWTFDAAVGACRRFIYGGCYGTSNRFASLAECEALCVASPARSRSRCYLRDRQAGPCANYTVRYSYVAAHDHCTPFFYGGCGGNANKFVTLRHCRKRCELKRAEDEAAEAAGVTEEGGLGEGQEETVTSEQPTTSADVCSLPRDPGDCSSYAPMFYHDTRTGGCHQFIYRGCEGNANRFHTRLECENRCLAASPAPGAESGSNTTETNSTEVAVSTTDAEENVTIEPTTASTSTTLNSEEPDLNSVNASTPSGRSGSDDGGRFRPRRRRACRLPHRQGPCRLYLPRFYYNARLGACYRFIYGGCGGNLNRFRTRKACETVCKNVRERQ